jgi:peptidoglycan-associated lipoprotein
MFKISKIAIISKIGILSALLLVSACNPPKKSGTTKATHSHEHDTHAAAKGENLDSFCYCPVKGTVGVTHFDFDSSVVLPEAQKLIDNGIAHCIAKRFAEDPAIKVLVTGHADKRGTQEYNVALGTRRADATKNYLLGATKSEENAANVSADRFCVNSKGKEELVDNGDSEAAHAKNRRTVIEFVEECN